MGGSRPSSASPAAPAEPPVGGGTRYGESSTTTGPRWQRPRGANAPWQTSRLMRGRGMTAASFSRNSDGSKHSARVPSRHGRRRRSTTLPPGVTSVASWATGERKMYRHNCSSRSSSPARPATLACRSKPSRCAWRGPPVVTCGAVGSLPMRSTCWPARGPVATRPITDAPCTWASTGDSSASGSLRPWSALPSRSMSWRRSRRRIRPRTRASRRATSTSLGGSRSGTKRGDPSPCSAKTPSATSVWKCGVTFSVDPQRWLAVTAPARPTIPCRMLCSGWRRTEVWRPRPSSPEWVPGQPVDLAP